MSTVLWIFKNYIIYILLFQSSAGTVEQTDWGFQGTIGKGKKR